MHEDGPAQDLQDGPEEDPPRPNAVHLQTARQPQLGILPPVDRCTGVVIVHLKEGFDVPTIGDALAACPSTQDRACPGPGPGPGDSAGDSAGPTTPDSAGPAGHGAGPCESVMAFASRLAAVHRPERLAVVIGLGTHRFGSFFPDSPVPKHLVEFEELCSADSRHRFPATGGDVLVHVKSSRQDLVEAVVAHLRRVLDGQIAPDGFTVHLATTSSDGRNDFGHPDAGAGPEATANPFSDLGPVCRAYPFGPGTYRPERMPRQLREACGPAGLRHRRDLAARDPYADLGRIATSFIGQEDSAHLNGSFCLVMRFVHDLAAFSALPSQTADEVFGRRRSDGARLPGPDGSSEDLAARLPRAHVARVRVRMTEPDGRIDPSPCLQNGPGASLAPAQIYRQPAQFQQADGTRGTIFVAYARHCDTFDVLLQRMLGRIPTWPGADPAVDHLLDFTTATSGQYFYIPHLQELTCLSEYPVPRESTDGSDVD